MTDPGGENIVRMALDKAEQVARPPDEPPADSGGGGLGGERRSFLGRGDLPHTCPVEPLGVFGEMFWYIDALRQLRGLKAKEHSKLILTGLFGTHLALLYDAWPRVNKEGKTVGWRAEAVAEALMVACSRRGVWDVWGRVRGSGAWKDAEGGLVFHCGDVIISAAAHHHVGRPRPQVDAQLLLGWVCAGLLGGALDWRPLVWITGDKATGKSTLHQVLHAVFGDDGILSVSDVSAAGIWQKLGHSTLPVAIDELEAEEDNRKAQNVIKLARQAASGGVILRGGADHAATEFKARSCFLFSSILV